MYLPSYKYEEKEVQGTQTPALIESLRTALAPLPVPQ